MPEYRAHNIDQRDANNKKPNGNHRGVTLGALKNAKLMAKRDELELQ
jgi:hypothetical protein